jgi:hypothetical protein
MAPPHISIRDHPLSILRLSGGIPKKTVDLLSNLKFGGEGKVYAFKHLNQFNIACHNLKKNGTMKYANFLP